MVTLSDGSTRARIVKALSLWNVTGYVVWKDVARAWVERNLEGHTTKAVAECMYLHAVSGGEIDQVEERRADYLEHRFHYDFRITIGGCRTYLETVLLDDDPDEPVVWVVSVHEQ